MSKTYRDKGILSISTTSNSDHPQNKTQSPSKSLSLQDLNSTKILQQPQTTRQQTQQVEIPTSNLNIDQDMRNRARTSHSPNLANYQTQPSIRSNTPLISPRFLQLPQDQQYKQQQNNNDNKSKTLMNKQPKSLSILSNVEKIRSNSHISPNFQHQIQTQQHSQKQINFNRDQQLQFFDNKGNHPKYNDLVQELKNLHLLTKNQQIEIQRLKNLNFPQKKAYENEIRQLQVENNNLKNQIQCMKQEKNDLIQNIQILKKDIDKLKNKQSTKQLNAVNNKENIEFLNVFHETQSTYQPMPTNQFLQDMKKILELQFVSQDGTTEGLENMILQQTKELLSNFKQNNKFISHITDLCQKCGQFEHDLNVKQMWKFIKKVFEDYIQLKGKKDDGEKEIITLTKQYLNIQSNKEIIPQLYSLQAEKEMLIDLFQDVQRRNDIEDIKQLIQNKLRFILP